MLKCAIEHKQAQKINDKEVIIGRSICWYHTSPCILKTEQGMSLSYTRNDGNIHNIYCDITSENWDELGTIDLSSEFEVVAI